MACTTQGAPLDGALSARPEAYSRVGHDRADSGPSMVGRRGSPARPTAKHRTRVNGNPGGGHLLNVVTLVPYRPAGDRHRWLWDHTLPALEALGWPVVVGEPRGDVWCRAEAVNAAAASAGAWDVALVADCDTIPDPGSIHRSLAWLMASSVGAVRPHLERFMLSGKGTVIFVQRGPAYLRREHFERRHAGGGLLLVKREAFDGVGGYDESYKGWGYEDSDFNMRVLRAYGWERLPGDAWHLWHKRGATPTEARSRQKYLKMLREHGKDIDRWSAGKGLLRPEKVL